METARLGNLFAHQGLEERATFEKDFGGQVPFPDVPEDCPARFGFLSGRKEPLATRLDHQSGLNPVCTNLSACTAQKASRKDFFKAA